jgi:hypothetical protein
MILDMMTHCCRAYYDDKGVLVYNLKDMRTRYLSGWFFLDLVAALPLQALVALNGRVNDRYSAWLRMPKMVRGYRIVQFYKSLSNYTGQVGVIFAVFRQLPLVFCITHLYGCVYPDHDFLQLHVKCMCIVGW